MVETAYGLQPFGSENSDDLKGLKEEGKLRALGIVGWRGAKAWANRQGRWAGLSKDGAVSSKEDLSADEFEEIQSLLNSRDPKRLLQPWPPQPRVSTRNQKELLWI